MSDWFADTAYSGSLLLAIPVALIAGLVSFFSPCVIPLLPGYLSYATGLSGAEIAQTGVGAGAGAGSGAGRAPRWRMLAGACLFVLGFTVVFVALGVASGSLGMWLVSYRRELDIGLGVLSILLGLVFLGALPLLRREWRVHRVPAVGLAAAPLLGFLFGAGWVPCIGPTLGVILSLAYSEGSATRGGALAAFYSLGLGVPFIVAGLAYQRMLGAVRFIRRHQVWVTRLGGLMMIVVGLLLVTGAWEWLTRWLQSALADYWVTGL